jgi:hypothetical protein
MPKAEKVGLKKLSPEALHFVRQLGASDKFTPAIGKHPKIESGSHH